MSSIEHAFYQLSLSDTTHAKEYTLFPVETSSGNQTSGTQHVLPSFFSYFSNERAIYLRIQQIKKLKNTPISDWDYDKLYDVAQKIENVISSRSQDSYEYVRKKESHLPLTLYFDHSIEMFHIKTQAMKGVGSYNKVQESLSVPYDRTLPPKKTVIRISKEPSVKYNPPKYCFYMPEHEKVIFQITQQEVEKRKLLQDPKDTMLSHINYTKPHSFATHLPIMRLATVHPQFDSDILYIMKNPSSFLFRTQVHIASQLLSHLSRIHAKGYIHNDIGPENCLWKKDTSDTFSGYIAVLSDFGSSFNTFDKAHYNWITERGYYGRIGSTAPEMLATRIQKNVWSIDLFKVEMFAMGVCLHAFFLRKSPIWEKKVLKIWNDKYRRPTIPEIESIEKDMAISIERELKLLEGLEMKEKLHPSLQLKKLIYSMMQRDPVKRPSAQEAVKHLTTIMNSL